MKSSTIFDWIAITLLVVGGLNWGMISAFDFDLVSSLFGDMTILTRVVYALVGVSALYIMVAAVFATSTAPVARVAHS
jgi:uncharacterized membrane protein YuzA (DUF378 family)